MCRIAGIASPYQPIKELQQTVASMCYVLRHGGPDDDGLFTSEEHDLVLGHRRLSLLDLGEAGHQPMQSSEGRYTITFNGEVYNYRELKAELRSLGYAFVSATDTEVILAAFAAWGEASFGRLNGMFAFALFDSLTANLYLVRDGMGMKPLYYSIQKKVLVFASEIKAFYQLQTPPEENPHWPVYLMAYGHLPEPVTTLKAVQPLPKGSFLRFDTRSGQSSVSFFEHLSFYEKNDFRERIIGQIQHALQAAVRRHLIADAPIGVFLSGGIDSSVIALLAGEAMGRNLNTLSLVFNEETYTEKKYQTSVLQKVQSIHHQHLLTEGEFHFHLPEIIAAMDLPCSDGINTWFISKLAAEAGLKAVLAGLGGDELFGGYPSFQRTALAARLQGIPGAALRAGRYSRSKRFRRLSYLSLGGTKGQYLFLRGIFIPLAIAQHLGLDEKEVWDVLEEAPVLPDIHHMSSGNRASWMELNLYLQNQLLRDADVMSMAHGVEIRVPFLDKEFVRLVSSLPSKEKYTGAFGKQLLIDSFRSLLPTDVWQRKKMGFSFPYAEWLKEDEWVKSKMLSGGRKSMAMLDKFEKGTMHWSGLMVALLLRTHRHETQSAFFNA